MNRNAPKQTRDAYGNKLCRMPHCGKPVGRGRRSYCSDECSRAFAIAYFPNDTRHAVFQRDAGVCAACGVDTQKVGRILSAYWKIPTVTSRDVQAVQKEIGCCGRWEVDHVLEVVRGGWGVGLDLLRTLCSECHKAETARLARERAIVRRLQGEK